MSVTKKFDEVGRVVIPQVMKRELGLKNGDEVRMDLEGDKIILTNPNKFNLEKYIEELMDNRDTRDDIWYVLNEILIKIEENK